MILSIPEVELATSAWFAVRVPGFLLPPIATIPPLEPIYRTSPFAVNASSPLARDVGMAVFKDLLICIRFGMALLLYILFLIYVFCIVHYFSTQIFLF